MGVAATDRDLETVRVGLTRWLAAGTAMPR